MRRLWVLIVLLVLGAPLAYVAWQAIVTLRLLDDVERERDSWQRPGPVLDALDLHPGQTVVDFGSGAGYFALKLAPIVGATGSVLAIDLRFESLAFLWMRARLIDAGQVHIIQAVAHDPRLPRASVDAVLIANTYHELEDRVSLVALLRERLTPGGRLVVLDRVSRSGREDGPGGHHELAPEVVARDLHDAGFIIVGRDDRFIDRASDEDIWWLIVAQKP